MKALEQLVVYAKNDKTLSWNWDRKTEGQYRLEIIVDTSNPLEYLVIKADSHAVLLAEIIEHIHYCPIGFNENSMIVSKSWSGKDLLGWLKKLHQLSKQSL